MAIPLLDVIASNARLASRFPNGLVGVFVGGTSGIGEYTAKALARNVPNSKVLVVGRSQEAADRIKSECQQYNTNCSFEFIKTDLSALKNVDELCSEIKSRENHINILLQTQGSLGFNHKTADGFNLPAGLGIYSRAQILFNLLPLLKNSPSHRRVVSVLAATMEGRIDPANIPAHGAGITTWAGHAASVTDFILEEASRHAPGVGFVHTYPGIVKSGIMRDTSGVLMGVLRGLTNVMMPLIATSPEESGERHLFFATNSRYAGSSEEKGDGVLATGVDGKSGGGVYSVDTNGKDASPKVVQLLQGMRDDGTAEKVWETVKGDLERITGSEIRV